MRKFKYIILLLIIVLGVGIVKSNKLIIETKVSNQNLFSQYLKYFKSQTIPFKMNREYVLGLGSSCDSFKEIRNDLLEYIPSELRRKYLNSKFKGMYLLPNYNKMKIVLLLNKYINEYDANITKVHIVIYSEYGKILDYKELAGFNLDIWESFLEINDKYILEQKSYKFKINKNPKFAKYFHLVETSSVYKINLTGLIKEINKVKKEGYFEGELNGYSLIKSL